MGICINTSIPLTPCNRFKYQVRKSILLRTFNLDHKTIILTVRLSSEINYERALKYICFYERF